MRIDPIYLIANNMRHTIRKAFDKSYNFALNHTSGILGEKNHLDVGPVERCKVYYKRGRWWLPPSPGRGESCVSVLPVVRPSTKGAPTMH